MSKTREKALISGYNGFVGKYLATALKERDIQPVQIPRNLLYRPFPELMGAIQELNPTYIFALHTYGNYYDQKKEDHIIMANYFAVWNMLQASKYVDYKALIHISTSSTLLPHETLYSASKAGAERLIRAYANEYGKPVVSVRPSTVIGKGEQENHLIPTLIRSCKTGEEMPFVGEPTHDYIDVRDLVEAIIFLAERAEEQKGKVFNASSNDSLSNSQVAQLVHSLMNKTANFSKVKSLRAYDNTNWKVDNTDLIKLGWQPKYDIIDTIMEMIDS